MTTYVPTKAANMVDIPDGVMAELLDGGSNSGSDDNCSGGCGGCLEVLYYILLVVIAIVSAIVFYSLGYDFLFRS